jgi:hypothetical protein
MPSGTSRSGAHGPSATTAASPAARRLMQTQRIALPRDTDERLEPGRIGRVTASGLEMLAASSQNTAWRNAGASDGSRARAASTSSTRSGIPSSAAMARSRAVPARPIAAAELEPAGVAHVALGGRLRHQRFVLALADHLAATKIGDEHDDAGDRRGAGRHVSRRVVLPQQRQSARCGFRVVTGMIGRRQSTWSRQRAALGADASHRQPEHGGSAISLRSYPSQRARPSSARGREGDQTRSLYRRAADARRDDAERHSGGAQQAGRSDTIGPWSVAS